MAFRGSERALELLRVTPGETTKPKNRCRSCLGSYETDPAGTNKTLALGPVAMASNILARSSSKGNPPNQKRGEKGHYWGVQIRIHTSVSVLNSWVQKARQIWRPAPSYSAPGHELRANVPPEGLQAEVDGPDLCGRSVPKRLFRNGAWSKELG